MDAHDLLARHGEHAERVVGAQIVLGGEGKTAQVVEVVQVIGMHPGAFEREPVMRDFVVGKPNRCPQTGQLQCGDLVAAGSLDRLARRHRLGCVKHHASSRYGNRTPRRQKPARPSL